MNTSSKKTKLLYLPAIGSLFVGLMLYIIFRENTYITKFLELFLDFDYLRHCARAWDNDFLKYYFPDFLWALSLNSWLHIGVSPGCKGSIACSLIAGGFGVFYEVLQYMCTVPGTFDFADIIMYLSAAMLLCVFYCAIIQTDKEKRR